MRVFACKDLDGACSVIRSEGEPVKPNNFKGTGDYKLMLIEPGATEFCRTLAPGTFRELKKLDVVSGEYEFVEVSKVPTLREAWEAFTFKFPAFSRESEEGMDLDEAIDRELRKPAPRYDEALIDELLEVGKGAKCSLSWLVMCSGPFDDEPNRRAAEILQSLKRAKEGV